jgi:transposase
MGAKAVLAAAKNKTDPVSRWVIQIQGRRGYWKAVVAVAAKNARLCWAMLQRGAEFKMPA